MNVSQQAWNDWQSHQTMLINEKQLSMANGEHRKYLQEQMDKYLSGENFDRAEGFVPTQDA
jgi:Fe-S cluster biosynthesis and repair protein YggX